MSTYRLKITVYNKDLDETEVRFDDIFNDGGEVCKVLKMVCCKIKGVRDRIKGTEDKDTLIEALKACKYIYEIEKIP